MQPHSKAHIPNNAPVDLWKGLVLMEAGLGAANGIVEQKTGGRRQRLSKSY
jgi:hypothetical protein